jgi:membrane-bound lytic murein transglycosylase B
MELKNRIEMAKLNLRKAENAKVQAETQKAGADQQLEEVKAKMLEAGVTPETIKAEIDKLQVQVIEDLDKVERLIPQV